MRRLLLAALAAVLVLASPALGDDEVEIDTRLQSAGLLEAFTVSADAMDGFRVGVDFVSTSRSAQEYDAEARTAAELVWRHLELQVLAVDVTPTSGVGWLDDGLPPARSYTRPELEREFGPRPAGLDLSREELYAEAGQDYSTLPVAYLTWSLAGLGLAGLAVVVAVLLRRRWTRAAVAGGPSQQWGGQQWGGQQWGGSPETSRPWSGPADPRVGAAAAGPHDAGAAERRPDDPWRTP